MPYRERPQIGEAVVAADHVSVGNLGKPTVLVLD